MRLLYPLAKRFIAGHDFDSAKAKIAELMKEGYELSIDYVGELSKNTSDAAAAAAQYTEISTFYKGKKMDLSIKPTQLGLLFDEDFCEELLRSVVKTARINGHTIRLDMEDCNVTDRTINLCLKLRKRFPNVGIAIQANLGRSEGDVDRLVKNDVSVRLVKGAYKGTMQQFSTSVNFLRLAYNLRRQKAYRPAIATHDEEILEKIDDKFYDYEFLYGVRRDLQKSLLNKGYTVRIYLPFGKDWLPYTLRRLKEWKNLKFVIRNILKEWLGLIKKK